MTEQERKAVERVKKAKVKAPEYVILRYVRSVGPESIMRASLRDILEVANAF